MYASTFRMSRSERRPFQDGMFGLPSWMVASRARSDFFLVAAQEIFVLVIKDSAHGEHHGLLALLDGVDKPLGTIDLLFDKQDGFFLFSRRAAAASTRVK